MTRDERLEWVEMFERTGHAGLVCDRFGISRPTLRKWVRRYQERGAIGLEETSRRPTSSPNRKVFEREEQLILELRRTQGLSMTKLRDELRRTHGIELSADTITKVLRRVGEPVKRASGRRRAAAAASLPNAGYFGWLGAEQRPAVSGLAGDDPVATAIADLISQGEFKPGQKLSERLLGHRLGLSRSQVREGVKKLALSGLICLERNRGAFVALPSLPEVGQAYAARRLIEGEIVADLCHHCTAHDIRQLRRHLSLQEEAQKAGDRGRLVRLLTEFHRILASLGENRVLEGFVENLTAKTSLAVLLYDFPGASSCAVDEHADLVKLLAAGDAEGARALMQCHLTTNQSRLPLTHDGEPKEEKSSL